MRLQLLSVFIMCLIGSSLAAHAQILLIVDESNPAAVTITATGNGPSTSVGAGNYVFGDGFDLEGIFASDASSLGGTIVPATTLTTGDGSGVLPFTDAISDNASNSAAFLDLGLFNGDAGTASDTDAETFTLGSPAFSGSLTLNLSGYNLAGLDGIVVAGYSGSTPGVVPIGTFKIVGAPEPDTWALLLGGLACLVGVRRKLA